MIPYQYIQTYGATDTTWLSALSDLTFATVEGRQYLFTVTQQHGGGVTAYQQDAVTGLLDRIDTHGFPAGASYKGEPEIALFDNGIGKYIHLTNLGTNEYLALSLSDDGQFNGYDIIASSDQSKPVTAFKEFETPQGRFLYSAFRDDLSIHITKTEENGKLTHHSSVKIPLPYPHENASVERLFVAHVADKKYIIAISGLGDFIAAYEIGDNGELGTGSLHTGNMGIGYHIPADAIAAEVAGHSYIVVASPGSSSLTVLKLGHDGKLNATDHVPDTLNTRFERITAIESVVLDGRAFIFVGGTDDGISVFTLQPGGTLLHLQSIADTDNLTLNQVSDIAARVHDGKFEIFVSSANETGITHLRFDPGKIGLTGYSQKVNALGTAENDLLIAARDARNLYGGKGDDILISGDTSVRFHGGPGADIFVPTGIVGTITIQDFEPGTDRLDLSQLRVAGSLHDLRMNIGDGRIFIRRLDTKIVVKTKDAAPFPEDDITNANFAIAHYDTPEQEPVFLPRPTAEELLKPYLLGEFPEEQEHPDPLTDPRSLPPSAGNGVRRPYDPLLDRTAACFDLAEMVRKNLPANHSGNEVTVGKSALTPNTALEQQDSFIFKLAENTSIESQYIPRQSSTALSIIEPVGSDRKYQSDTWFNENGESIFYNITGNEFYQFKISVPVSDSSLESGFLL